ncbi:MBL fold metallo-hydrolase [Paenibacillus sp. PDC88]|uniref:MBL fold metallo-hydrolase n=1 Tax=Paenibacillus sp. PDC88 TaxID=1884375 RepID=UPI000897BA72|nr:MBL fold metallo-hydrolase [Paenibacillus sp. PDC88]SDW91689.1 Ribonuclease BN, tRNA processing enzyme [Paenibacillus sp. PDC88]
MKIKILGYWGGYPAADGATAGFLIQTGEGQLLLDCGSGVMSQLAKYTRVEQLDGVILSHLHYDHMADIGILQYAATGALRNGRMNRRLPIYAPAEPAGILNTLYGDHSEIVHIEEEQPIFVAGAKIEFVPVRHTIPCYAVKITYGEKVIVYSADTSYCESLIDIAQNADLFLCEATICDGSVHTSGLGHMNAHQAGTIASKANVKKLILVHLPGDGDFDSMLQSACAAFEGPVELPDTAHVYTL